MRTPYCRPFVPAFGLLLLAACTDSSPVAPPPTAPPPSVAPPAATPPAVAPPATVADAPVPEMPEVLAADPQVPPAPHPAAEAPAPADLLAVLAALPDTAAGPAPQLSELRGMLSEIPPEFTPPAEGADMFTALEPELRRAQRALGAASALAVALTDAAARAELREMASDLLQRIRPVFFHRVTNLVKSIPQDLRGMATSELDALKQRVNSGIGEADRFVRLYPGDPGLSRVRAYLARLLFLQSSVAMKEWEDAYEARAGRKAAIEEIITWKTLYFDRIFQLVDAALSDAQLDDGLREQTTKLKADALGHMARNAEAAALYVDHLRRWPSSPSAKDGLAYVNAGQRYLYAEDGAKAEAILREGMAKAADTPYFSHIGDFFFKALTATGNLEDAEALWLKHGPVYLARADDPTRS